MDRSSVEKDRYPDRIETRRISRVMRSLLVGAMVLAVSAAMPAGNAAADGRTHVTSNCRHATIRPRHIIFTCEGEDFYMTQGVWASWHRWRAVGTGLFHANDCDPSCVEGTFHSMRGEVVLRHRALCPDAHRHRQVFTRAMITFEARLVGH